MRVAGQDPAYGRLLNALAAAAIASAHADQGESLYQLDIATNALAEWRAGIEIIQPSDGRETTR